MDEIDRCLFEVNALLGSPEPAAPVKDDTLSPNSYVHKVEKKFLDHTIEFKRLFGSDTEENRR